jgi:hypothetical protein
MVTGSAPVTSLAEVAAHAADPKIKTKKNFKNPGMLLIRDADTYWAVATQPLLLSDDFDEYALLAPTVKFSVKNLLPRPKIQLAVGDGDDNLPAEKLAADV